MQKIAIILVNYDNYAERFLDECHKSLERQSYPKDRVTLYIVNNAVPANQRAALGRIRASNVRILESPGNLGWGGGNNLGIGEALKEDADAVVFLNIDTVMDEHWLEELVRAAEDGSAHLLQSKILLHGTSTLNSLGNHIHFLGYGYCHGYGQPESAVAFEPPHFASGAALLVKKEVFATIGLFREDYFLYYDDLEFSWRARLAGFKVGVAVKSVCFHKYEFSDKLKRLYFLERNRLVTLFTLARKRTLLLLFPALLITQLVSGIYFACKGHGKAIGKLLKFFANGESWKKIAEERRKISALRRLPDRDIVKCFKGAIVFAAIREPLLETIANPLLRAYWAVVRLVIFW